MLYIMYGAEEYMLRKQKRSFKESADMTAYKEFTETYAALNYLDTLTLFSNTLWAYLQIDKAKEVYAKDHIERFNSIAADQEKHLLIHITGNVSKKELQTLKSALQGAFIAGFEKYSASQLLEALSAICELENANFTDDAKAALIERLDYAGNDSVTLITMENYIDQLKYIADTVEKVDVENNVPDLRLGKRFELAKLISSGNTAAVMTEAERLERERGFSAMMLMGLLHREYRIAYLLALGYSLKDQAVSFSGLPHMQKDTAFGCLQIITERLRDIKTGVYEEKTAWRLCLTQLLSKCKSALV